MKKIKTFLSKKITIFFLLLGAATAFLSRRYAVLSADPTGPKDCPPLVIDADGNAVPHSETAAVENNVALAGIGLPWLQRGGTINDASCLNRTPIHGAVRVETEADVLQAINYAKENDLRVSIAGVRHSMGGHAFAAGSCGARYDEFQHH